MEEDLGPHAEGNSDVERKAILESVWEPQIQGPAGGLKGEGDRVRIISWRIPGVGARSGWAAKQQMTVPSPTLSLHLGPKSLPLARAVHEAPASGPPTAAGVAPVRLPDPPPLPLIQLFI